MSDEWEKNNAEYDGKREGEQTNDVKKSKGGEGGREGR